MLSPDSVFLDEEVAYLTEGSGSGVADGSTDIRNERFVEGSDIDSDIINLPQIGIGLVNFALLQEIVDVLEISSLRKYFIFS